MAQEKLALTFDDNTLLPALLGEYNAHLDYLEDKLRVTAAFRGNTIYLEGEDRAVQQSAVILNNMIDRLREGQEVTTATIDTILRFQKEEDAPPSQNPSKKNNKQSMSKNSKNNGAQDKTNIRTYKNKPIDPRSPNQARYVEAINHHDLVFGIGPAGTGKTFLAVAAAVQMYKDGLIERMVFCRPAVEAGEQLGFLPGDMLEKIDPYLRPIYDALHDMMPPEDIPKKIARGDIEIAPLAFMRGRTLKNAFVVLDEAQNTTSMQMKMFLTRMGEGTRMVITGDPSQVDLPPRTQSGLKEVMTILRDIEEVPFIHFTAEDVVRHPLVSKIIKAYDRHEYSNRSG